MSDIILKQFYEFSFNLHNSPVKSLPLLILFYRGRNGGTEKRSNFSRLHNYWETELRTGPKQTDHRGNVLATAPHHCSSLSYVKKGSEKLVG